MQNNDLKKYLESQNFVPSKKMGQNFLINKNTQLKLIESVNLNSDDNVLEIGPGLGAITQHLLKKTKNVLAIELDKRLYSFLKDNYPSLILINDDVLGFDIDRKLKEMNWNNVKVVANLPYSISSLIILKLIKSSYINEINILVQKEMAQRLLAKVNTKNYNAFTILVSMYANIECLVNVSQKDFLPQPKVDSQFIRLKLLDYPKINFDSFSKFLKLCFLSRRKKLTNNLNKKYSIEKIHYVLKELDIDLNTRSENLTKEQFMQLYEQLEKNND